MMLHPIRNTDIVSVWHGYLPPRHQRCFLLVFILQKLQVEQPYVVTNPIRLCTQTSHTPAKLSNKHNSKRFCTQGSQRHRHRSSVPFSDPIIYICSLEFLPHFLPHDRYICAYVLWLEYDNQTWLSRIPTVISMSIFLDSNSECATYSNWWSCWLIFLTHTNLQ